MTQRVDRLTRAFDAFVELSQLRDELVLHADARRWRTAARRLVESRIAHAPSPAATNLPPDVPGYWLTELLAADVVDQGHPARARLAIELLGRPLETSADRLLAIATAPYVPKAAREVRRTVDRTPDRWLSREVLTGGAAIAVVAIVLAVAASPGWIALVLIVAAALGGAAIHDAVTSRAHAGWAANVASEAERTAAERASAETGARAAADDAAERARAARDRLGATLAALTTPAE